MLPKPKLFSCIVVLLLFISFRPAAQDLYAGPKQNPAKQYSFDHLPKNLSFPNPQPVNGCGTWTFHQQISTVHSELATDAIQLPNDNYILAGYDSSAAGIRARLIKLNSQGNILHSRYISIPGKQVSISRVRYFSNGKLYAIGSTQDLVTGQTMPLVFRVDTATLVLIDVMQMDVNTGTNNWKGCDLAQGPDGSDYFLLSYNDSLLNVTRVTMLTNIPGWSRTFRPRNHPRPIGIGVEHSDVYVSWNETDSGYSKGVMMDLNRNNGDYKHGSRTGGLAEGLNIEFSSMIMINLRPRITGLQWKNGEYKMIRLNYSPSVFLDKKDILTINGITPSAGMHSRQDSWSQVLAFQQGTSDNLHLIQTWPDNDNTPIRSWKMNYNFPVRLASMVLTNDGGSLILAGVPGAQQKLIITKIDSVAMLPGCSPVEQEASFQKINQPPHKNDTIPGVAYSFQFSLLSPTEGISTMGSVEYCKTLYCPPPPQTDSCLRTFFKEYRNYTNSIISRAQIGVGQGKFLLLSNERIDPYNAAVAPTRFTIMDTSGNILDSRILNNNLITLYTLTLLSDGSILATGSIRNEENPSEILLVKFDLQFNMLWQKKLVTSTGPGYNIIEAVTESAEGDLYCYLRDKVTAPTETRTMLKLDAAGNPVWMKQYSIGPTIFSGSNEWVPDLVELGSNIVFKYNDEASDYSPYLASIRKTDGGIQWVKKYQMPGPYSGSQSYALNNLATDGINIYMSGRSQNMNILLRIREDGSVSNAKRSVPASAFLGWIGVKPGGRLITSAGLYSGDFVNGVIEMDTSFNILRKQYMVVPKSGRNRNLIYHSDSVTYAAGSLFYDNHYWSSLYFQKYNFNSSFASCAVTEPPLVLESFVQPVTSKTITEASLPLPQMVNYTSELFTAHLAYSSFYCGNNISCTALDLQGPANICDTINIYAYSLVRNPGCTGAAIWEVDSLPGQVKIISITDTLIKLRALTGGTFILKARVFANCDWLLDSIIVQASAGNSFLNLGPDTTLCPGNTILLKAGQGFASYSWQDGSTDSLYTVTTPGLYYVDVTTCNGLIRDSVLVTQALPIPFSVGPDRSKCDADTIQLHAPAGFLNYTWSPAYNISGTSEASVVVNPAVDTAYYIKAEKTPGCFAFDTVRIKVFHSIPINLGGDVSFCNGDSASFSAGSSFVQYLWNTGATTEQITVKVSGTYFVSGTSTEGCLSYDTVKVINVFPNPVINLDKTTAICTGSSKILDAGNFANYQWNTGSTAKSITVNNIGEYIVTVTDQNGCKATDTSIISTLYPLPSGFLPEDTTLCSYSRMELKPLISFQTYQWNTGSMASSITINQPGHYWLEVKDQNNCTGRDTVQIEPENCMEGFYIPSAFTPNGDQKNDVFRPMLFGNVKKYQFTIYNRWGEVIFQTNELSKGWNGSVGGKLQLTNVFVWQCTYQFEGQAARSEKGTVLLVR